MPELDPPAASTIEGQETPKWPKPVGPVTLVARFTVPANPSVVAGRLDSVTITWELVSETKLTLVALVDMLTPATWMLRIAEFCTARPDAVSLALYAIAFAG